MTLLELVKACGNIKDGKITKVQVWDSRGDYLGECVGKSNIDRLNIFVGSKRRVKRFDVIGKRLEVIVY